MPANGTSEWLDNYLRDPWGALQALAAHIGDWTVAWAPVFGPIMLVAGVAGTLLHRGWRRRCHRRLHTDARVVTVLVPPTVDPSGGAALWANLVGLLRPTWARWLTGQPHVACEYLFSQAGVTIRLWVPGVIPPGLVERAVEAAWPGSHTRTEPAGPPLPSNEHRVTVGGQLRLARPEALPIRSDFDADPLRALFGAPTGLGRHESACVQIMARPATGTRLARARRAARRLQAGHSPRPVGQLLDLITPGPTPSTRTANQPSQDPQASLEQSASNRSIVAKQRGGQYETLIRYAVTTRLEDDASADQVEQAHATARGRAHALASTFAAYTDHNHYRRTRLRHSTSALAERRFSRGDLLSVPELAGLAHLPVDEGLPGLSRAGANAIAPGPDIATSGPEVKPLGTSDTGPARAVGLRVADARHHLHVLGATGSGKSTLLARMILDDAKAGRGQLVIDPKGDLVTDVLARLPQHLGERTALFDADSRHRPPCLNPLQGTDPDATVDHLVSVFRRVYSAFWGPRTDDVMRAACLTLRAQDGVATLADLPRLLGEDAFRARLTRAVTDPVLTGFWSWYEGLTDAGRNQVIAPLMNKLRAFLLRPFVRDALAAGASTVDMSRMLDGGLCLVRIPKGSLGEDTTRLVGSLLVARAWQATTARAAQPQRERHDAAMVIDECHNFLNLAYPLEDMLAEARGYRVSMTLAHQHLGQLPRELREGIAANARNKIFFTAGPDDARQLARHTAPRLGEHDLAHLGAFHAAARLVAHGAEADPCTLTTEPLPAAIPGRAREIRHAARTHTAAQATEESAPARSSSRTGSDPRRS